ncbi:hypothetical protein CABS03_11294 [Colletotrichum abscissum]|uniref:Uncharacterized protein n=1 Tax=Colletotrichum abscissum TaxID=1671311 RepID=A0A9P9XS16_9PEZI|nr:hypothetical protein CABS02_01008 [Colletotrichum abscissum]
MEFSFPLRVWRTDSSLRIDGRGKTAGGQSLRSSRDVTFLRHLSDCHHEDGSIDAIYASHISCAVTGLDQYRWTGILFAEDWFETPGDDPAPDTIERYDNDLMDGLACDPLARGRVDASRSGWYPRSYFLSILEIRLLQAHDEWLALLFRLETKIKGAVRTPGPPSRNVANCLTISLS